MKRVKLLTDLSTKDAVHHAGDLLVVEDAQAESLIEHDLAEAAPAGERLETAMEDAAPERATHPRGRGR